MKTLFILLLASFLAAGTSYAQSAKDLAKERKELAKLSKSALNDRASKTARKEAKRLKKAGWLTAPGALPLDKQLDKSYLMQYEYDENGYPKYIMGEAMSVGGNYDAAKMQALELDKQNLAGQIQTGVTALIENTAANKQLEAEEAATITQRVLASKNLISQSIGRTITIMESYRTLSNKNKEVLVEGVSKRSKEQLFGRTEQNKVVVFDRGTHRIGDFVNVRITDASSATLKGEAVDPA